MTVSLAIAMLAGAPRIVRADSPLTSTDFHVAYADDPSVAYVQAHRLDALTIDRLRDPAIPNDVRAAMINALGWRLYSTRGPERAPINARKMLAVIAQTRGTTPARLRISMLSTEELFALGYMAAMDRYRDLAPIGGGRGEVQRATPQRLLALAAQRAPRDYAVHVVHALVVAKAEMETVTDPRSMRARTIEAGFCRCWQAFESASHVDGPQNMRPAAVRVIDDYMRSYAGYCR